MSKPLIFTVTSDPSHAGAERLRRSASYWGWDLKWIIQADGWERKSYRAEQLGQLRAFLDHDVEFALYLDAWDTLFMGPPQELQFKRGQFNFCGDTTMDSWKDKDWAAKIIEAEFPPAKLGEFPYVNAGVKWGDVTIWKELIGDYLSNYREDLPNQDYFNKRYAMEQAMGRTRLKVDSRAEVALNIMDVQARFVERMYNNRLRYKPFNTFPLVMHSPGTGLTDPVAPMPNWMTEIYCAT